MHMLTISHDLERHAAVVASKHIYLFQVHTCLTTASLYSLVVEGL